MMIGARIWSLCCCSSRSPWCSGGGAAAAACGGIRGAAATLGGDRAAAAAAAASGEGRRGAHQVVLRVLMEDEEEDVAEEEEEIYPNCQIICWIHLTTIILKTCLPFTSPLPTGLHLPDNFEPTPEVNYFKSFISAHLPYFNCLIPSCLKMKFSV